MHTLTLRNNKIDRTLSQPFGAIKALECGFEVRQLALAPMLILFAAAGLTSPRDVLREARWRTLAAGVAAAACNHAMVPKTLIRSGTHINLGNALPPNLSLR